MESKYAESKLDAFEGEGKERNKEERTGTISGIETTIEMNGDEKDEEKSDKLRSNSVNTEKSGNNETTIQPSKTISVAPSESMSLVMKAVSHVYQRIIGKGDDKGELKGFLDRHAPKFEVNEGEEEHRLEWQILYQEYEVIIDKALNDFAVQQKMELQDVVDTINRAMSEGSNINGRMSKYLNLLTAAGR